MFLLFFSLFFFCFCSDVNIILLHLNFVRSEYQIDGGDGMNCGFCYLLMLWKTNGFLCYGILERVLSLKHYPNQSTQINRNCYCSTKNLYILFILLREKKLISKDRSHFPEIKVNMNKKLSEENSLRFISSRCSLEN